MWYQMLTILTVIISQYIHILNHYVCLKLKN